MGGFMHSHISEGKPFIRLLLLSLLTEDRTQGASMLPIPRYWKKEQDTSVSSIKEGVTSLTGHSFPWSQREGEDKEKIRRALWRTKKMREAFCMFLLSHKGSRSLRPVSVRCFSALEPGLKLRLKDFESDL